MIRFQLYVLFHLGIVCILQAQEVEVIGEIRVDSIEILAGAGQDKVLTSDENGSASWRDIGIKERYIVSPGMVNLFFGGAAIDSFPTSIKFPNASSPGIALSIPVPSSDIDLPVKVRILYTSTTEAGTFALIVKAIGVAVGDHTEPSSTTPPPLILDHPTAAFHLAEAVTPEISSITADTRFINLALWRSSADGSDTSTGDLKLIGLIVEYN
jgi:hypothetical protein